jgi:hypothetical protein
LLEENIPTKINTLDNLRTVLQNTGVPPYKSATMLQARLALRQVGLIDQVNALVAASTSSEIQDTWEYASEVDRQNPILLSLSQQLSLSSSQIDAIFIMAVSLP